MTEKVLIVKYGEIAMRGNNRKLFITRLVNALRRNLDTIGNYYVVREQGRLIIEDRGGEMDYEKVIPQAICVLGVIGVSPGVKTTKQELKDLQEIALEHMRSVYNDETALSFKVNTKRSDKRYPMTSNEVSAMVGGYILEHYKNLSVDVKNPQMVLTVELRNDAYLYSKMIKGFGGLPVGSSGKAMCMLSGGIDSPVAAFLAAKRGVEVEGVYFHSPPYTSEKAKQKVCDLAERLSVFTGGFRLYVVPFTEVQLYLLDNVPHDKLTIFLKRAMTKVAHKLAIRYACQGIVTGDSIGQVASQTMHGLNAINSVTNFPILRPLCGMDKQEIVDIARKIETFDISIRPYEDCCTVFVAKHPETRPKTSVIEKIEGGLDRLEELINKSIDEMEIVEQ